MIDHLRNSTLKGNASVSSNDDYTSSGIVADPQHPLRLVTIVDVLFYFPRRILQVCGSGVHQIHTVLWSILRWIHGLYRSCKRENRTRRSLLGIGEGTWKTYDDVFDRLRIVPTGHSVKLNRPVASLGATPEIFYYAWRPATRFKKTDPPLPEFQIAVMDARKTTLPNAYSFETLFENVPLPLSQEDFDTMDEADLRAWQRSEEERKRNDESYGKGAVRKLKAAKTLKEGNSQERTLDKSHSRLLAPLRRLMLLLNWVARLCAHLPPGCTRTSFTPRNRRSVNIYGPLKNGRRNVIVAVNDCGTTSLLRFGEAEFARWRLAGEKQP